MHIKVEAKKSPSENMKETKGDAAAKDKPEKGGRPTETNKSQTNSKRPMRDYDFINININVGSFVS